MGMEGGEVRNVMLVMSIEALLCFRRLTAECDGP